MHESNFALELWLPKTQGRCCFACLCYILTVMQSDETSQAVGTKGNYKSSKQKWYVGEATNGCWMSTEEENILHCSCLLFCLRWGLWRVSPHCAGWKEQLVTSFSHFITLTCHQLVWYKSPPLCMFWADTCIWLLDACMFLVWSCPKKEMLL